MKVLWFSNTPALGSEYLNKHSKIKGTGGWMHALNQAIQDHIELTVAFHYPYKKDTFKYQNTNYFPVYTGNIILENLKRRFLNKVYDEDFLIQYLDVIEKVKPDIIHIHGTENSFLCIIEKTTIPIVVSIQGNLTVYNYKFFSGFHGKHLRKKDSKITFKNLLFGWNSYIKGYKTMTKMSMVESKHLKNANHIIGRTDWDRRITRILAPNSKYLQGEEMLREGFYQSLWDDPYSHGKIKLFTTNGNNYYKGFETVCYSLHLLNESGLDVEWRVAGVTKDSLINKITRKHLGKNYPEKGLVLLGSLHEDELIKNLQNSHIYIMPSHIENSPNNLCEAMILGMPCIATFAGGTSSMMKDGEEGILVQDGDPWVMAGAIVELLNNPEKAIEMGQNARARALARHDKETISKNLIEVYKSIVECNLI